MTIQVTNGFVYYHQWSFFFDLTEQSEENKESKLVSFFESFKDHGWNFLISVGYSPLLREKNHFSQDMKRGLLASHGKFQSLSLTAFKGL